MSPPVPPQTPLNADVIVVGAGLAGLTCARLLLSSGYSVQVIEKSRGVGGRVATRRASPIAFDHGARMLTIQGSHTQSLTEALQADGVLQPWPQHRFIMDEVGQLCAAPVEDSFAPPTGMTAIAKYLAREIPIQRSQRVVALKPTDRDGWSVYVEAQPSAFAIARAVVLAIPAPQVLPLIDPLTDVGLSEDVVAKVRSVRFSPCFSAIASYPKDIDLTHPLMGDRWDAVAFASHTDLSWVGVDSTKRPEPTSTILVIQSSDKFAEAHLDVEDLQEISDRLVKAATQSLGIPQLGHPEWIQVQRWRYAFCRQPLPIRGLMMYAPAGLGCAGDWCGGDQIEDALKSGEAIAQQIMHHLDHSAT